MTVTITAVVAPARAGRRFSCSLRAGDSRYHINFDHRFPQAAAALGIRSGTPELTDAEVAELTSRYSGAPVIQKGTVRRGG